MVTTVGNMMEISSDQNIQYLNSRPTKSMEHEVRKTAKTVGHSSSGIGDNQPSQPSAMGVRPQACATQASRRSCEPSVSENNCQELSREQPDYHD